MPPLKTIPKVRSENIVVQDLGNEILIYDLKMDKAFCLNEVSKAVWQACDGQKNIAEIVDTVSLKLNSPPNEDLIWFALNQLKKEKLIENGNELPNHFAEMSRREIIKKVGLGTMMALPIVASIVAPSSIQAAASFCNIGTMCNCNTDVGMGNTCMESGGPNCISFMTGGMNCMCVQSSNGNTMGTCQFV